MLQSISPSATHIGYAGTSSPASRPDATTAPHLARHHIYAASPINQTNRSAIATQSPSVARVVRVRGPETSELQTINGENVAAA